MKFGFYFNQLAVIKAGLVDKTDICDWFILSYIKEWNDTQKGLRHGTKTWIDYQHLLDDLPSLGINTKGGLSKRLAKLEALGLISIYSDPEGSRIFAETTAFYSQILYDGSIDGTKSLGADPVSCGKPPVSCGKPPVSCGKPPVSCGKPINIPVSIHQYPNTSIHASVRDSKSKKEQSLIDKVMDWYQQQGFTESIQQHLEYFISRIANYEHIPRDLPGHFKRAIEEDWAGLRRTPDPEWAKLPPPGADLVRFIVQHGFPNRLRHLDTEEQCRQELKRLITQRLIEHRLQAA